MRSHGVRLVDDLEADIHKIVHINELHESPAVAGQDNRPVVAKAIPEERFSVVWIARAVNERRPESHDGNPVALVHSEHRPLGHCLIARVGVCVRIGSQRVTFVVIQTIAIRRDTGHEHVSRQPVTGGLDGSLTWAAVVPRCQS